MSNGLSFRPGVRAAATSVAAAVLAVGVALAVAPAVIAPDVIGDWQGTLTTGNGSLRIVVHLVRDKDGNLTGTMDSPDQGAAGIVLTSATYAAPDLQFAIKNIGAGYDGKFDKDKQEFTGDWKQGAASLPLTLSRVKK